MPANRRSLTASLALVAFLAIPGCSAASPGAAPTNASPATSSVAEPAAADRPLTVSPASERAATPGPAQNFTGNVMITALSSPTGDSPSGSGQVVFEAGARTAWHTHPAGQSLIVTAGSGWVQEEGGAKQTIAPGDVVSVPAGVKHWHGATATESMSHIAVQDAVNGANATWFEQVTDTQYTS